MLLEHQVLYSLHIQIPVIKEIFKRGAVKEVILHRLHG
jgi:hypothetical protein